MSDLSCPKCGGPRQADELHCSFCGQSFATASPTPPPVPPQAALPPPVLPAAAINPYASPAAHVDAVTHSGDGVWHEGKLLVMRKEARLPDRCIHCNQPATEKRIRKTVVWHPPAWYLLILIGILVYLIVAMIVRKRLEVAIPLCAEHKKKRWINIAVAWALVLGSWGLIIVGIADSNRFGSLILVGVLVFLVGIIFAMLRTRLLTPTRIDDRVAKLKGASPEFLRAFPPWPGG